MTKTIRFACLSALLFLFFPCTAQPTDHNKILFELGGEPQRLGKFNYYFLKNTEAPSPDSAKIMVHEYLDLYINFRLKVREALAQRKDETPEFIEEFESYKKQLSEPYLTQTQINEEMVREAYNRSTTEVSASHILISVNDDTNPEDTLRAYEKAMEIKNSLTAGADFREVAARVSDDPSAKQNGGNLGYFSALQMVYPFENAVYNHEVGELVGPVKTRFGYHIIKIEDKRPARGKILVAHIMIRAQPDSSAMSAAKNKAESIHANLMEGADWDQQCSIYSDDIKTKATGGQLPWFGTGNLVPEFEDAAYGLKASGDMSEPIQTRFGWHIIKLLDRKGVPAFEDVKDELSTKISRDTRAKETKVTAIKKLKITQDFKVNQETYDGLIYAFDSTLLAATWNYDTSDPALTNTLLVTNEQSYTLGDFLRFVHDEQKIRKTTPLHEYVQQLYNQFAEKCIFEEELKIIEAGNFEYQMVLDEYRSGILLFNQMEEEVWTRAMTDTVALSAFYETNKKKKYGMSENAVVRKFISKDTSVLYQVVKMLDRSNSELDSLFNAKEPLTLQTFDENIEKGKRKWLDDHWKEGTSLEQGEQYATLWCVVEIRPNGHKSFDDIRGLVIADYQKELEQQWLKTLRKKYAVKINKSVLKAYIEKFEN